MVVEPPVFDSDEGLGQLGRHFTDRDRGAAHFAAGCEDAAVAGVDRDGGGAFRNFQRLDWRQVKRDPGEQASQPDSGPEYQHYAPVDQADKRGASALLPASAAPVRPGLVPLRAPAAAAAAKRGAACAMRVTAGVRGPDFKR